jgi:hypothetical protein
MIWTRDLLGANRFDPPATNAVVFGDISLNVFHGDCPIAVCVNGVEGLFAAIKTVLQMPVLGLFRTLDFG